MTKSAAGNMGFGIIGALSLARAKQSINSLLSQIPER